MAERRREDMEAGGSGSDGVRLDGAGAVGFGVDTKSMKCENCGATVSYSAREKSLACPYCDSNYVIEASVEDIVRPEGVIPFMVPRDRAAQRFREWLGNGFFRPGDLVERARPERMRGVYLPYWAFSCSTESSWSASAGYTYKETETRRVTDADGTEREERVEVTKVRWEPVTGTHRETYENVLVPGSKGLDAKLLKSIEPFQMKDLQPYTPDVLAGWEAESYAVDKDGAWPEGKRIVERRIELAVADMVPGDKHKDISVSTTFSDVSAKLLLLPLWISAYNYEGKVYRFIVNGQTGEVQGEAPTSKAKLMILIAVVVAVLVTLGLLVLR